MRPILLLVALMLMRSDASAATFDRARLLPELGLDALTRDVARAELGRDVFANPWAAVTIATVDVYGTFPYVESRTFEVVSDPRWHRLVYGEAGRSLAAYDGRGTAFGPLREPRGLAVDERRRVYVADAGNDRILALDARTEFGAIALVPVFEVTGLSDPHGLAYSDGGTPFAAGDDVLYVADTGRNRVVALRLGERGATMLAGIGGLGSGPGRFAGPLAVAAGRAGGASTREVYVADAHTRRIVRLRHEGDAFRWIGAATIDADVVTSLDTDPWGNVYAAAPRAGFVRKFNAALEPVADLRDGLRAPRAFHVPFASVSDHRAGTTVRVGKAAGLAVEEWGAGSGLRLWTLGLELDRVALAADAREARFALTDRAAVTLEWVDPASGRTLARREAGTLDAGAHALALDASEAAGVVAGRALRVTAASSYPGGATVSAWASGGTAIAGADGLRLLGHSPNPVITWTRIAFALPPGAPRASLALYDASGRRVRHLGSDFGPGVHEVLWNGADDLGRDVAGGVYFYRVEAGAERRTGKLVRVR